MRVNLIVNDKNKFSIKICFVLGCKIKIRGSSDGIFYLWYMYVKNPKYGVWTLTSLFDFL